MVKFKKASFLPLLIHIGPAIFHCNMGEETSSIAHHVTLHMLFLTEVIEFWRLLPIADNSWLKFKKKHCFCHLQCISHIGSAIFYWNMDEQICSMADHVAQHVYFLTAVTEFWLLSVIADKQVNLQNYTSKATSHGMLPTCIVSMQ